MFKKRKRKKEATRRFREAIAAEWERRGVKQRSAPDFWEAARQAGLWDPADPASRLAVNRLGGEVIAAARASLSNEDKFIVTGGREGHDPFKSR